MGRGNRLPQEQLEPYLLPMPPEPRPFDWREVFGNERPVEIEVGFGKGLFLLTSAQANPEVNYLGVEVVRKYQLFTATRMAKRELHNVRLACYDGRLFLRDHVAGGSVAALHVYFPDPWWKKRHEKRRLFTPEFAVQCERVLRPGGLLNVVSDVEEYFGVMRRLVAEQTRLSELPPPEPGTPEHDLDYLTNFERKFRNEGRPIYRGAYERSAGVP